MTTALDVGRRLAAGELDARDVCEAALGRARSTPAAFTVLTEERARREAAASAERHRAAAPVGPLDGVPVAWKDLVDVAGTPTTAASARRRDAPPASADAPIVARLAAAGMVCIGKTNLSELAYSGLGLNPHFGTPPNPRGTGPARAPGGSSSGAAVAVAAGVVPCAIGSDTSGSIRVPAAFCGIAGFKPSAARIERSGLLPLAPTMDSVGPLATSVADLIAVDAALRGRPVPPLGGAPAVAPLRLVVPAGELAEDVDPGVARCFAAALAALADAGARIERRPLPAVDAARASLAEHGTLVAHEAWRTHAALLDALDAGGATGADADGGIDRRVMRRLREGRELPAEGYDALLRERPRLQAAVAAELGPALVVLPTAPHVAPEIAALERDDDHFMAVNTRTLRATLALSFLDMPGVSLPMGSAEDGMPAGLLVTGPGAADDRVLAAALAAEAALAGVAGLAA